MTYTGVIAAAVVTGILGLLYGVVVAVLRADQIVAGVGLNIIAIGATSLLRRLWGLSAEGFRPCRDPWRAAGSAASGHPVRGRDPLQAEPDGLPLPMWSCLWWRSSFYERARACYSDPSVSRRRQPTLPGWAYSRSGYGRMTFGGVMAGLAGAYLSVVVTSGVFIDNMTLGRGFLAIAITILAGWRPGWVAAAALFFGAAEALQFSSQVVFGGSVPAPLLLMLPFVATIIAWSVVGRAGRIPGDLGRPFVRGWSPDLVPLSGPLPTLVTVSNPVVRQWRSL